MFDRLIPILLGLLLVCGGLFVMTDAERMQGARTFLGLSAKEASQNTVKRQQPQVMEAEIARLSALPVPGIETPEGAEPVMMGVLASRARDCVIDANSAVRPPKERARAGIMRYLLILGATAADPESPLVEPRVWDLGPLLAVGPEALIKQVDAETAAQLAAFHEVYKDVNHPVYHGLQLYPQTFDALEFDKLVGNMAKSARDMLACATAGALPAPPASPETGAGQGDTASN